MTLRAYYRRDLALAQLETALRLFGERKDLASVITLAGAADEIFGKLLTISGGESSLASLTKAVAAIHKHLYGEPGDPTQIASRANLARNSLKHWHKGDPEIIKFDLEVEARDMLNRAIDNYWNLEQELSPSMEAFQRESLAANL